MPLRRSRGGLGYGATIAFGVAIALVLAVAGAATLELQRFREASNLVRHTLDVLTQSDDFLRHLIDAEATQRGFLLTGDERYMEPYTAASQAVSADFDRLRSSLASDAGQRARLEEIGPLVEGKLAEMENTIHLRKLEGPDAALEVVRTDYGRKVMDDIRRRLHDVRETESQQLGSRFEERDVKQRRVSLLIVIGGLLAAGIIAASTAALQASWKRRQRVENELRASGERLAVTLRSIGDAVITADPEGRVEFLNPIAQALTGWSESEARGRSLDEVFAIVTEGTRAKVESPVAKVLRLGTIVGLANHTLLIARDGRETPIEDSGAPIRDDEGSVIGVVLVFRDATERRRADIERERALRAEAEKAATTTALRLTDEDRALLQTIFDATPLGLGFIDRDARFARINRALAALHGKTVEQSLGRDVAHAFGEMENQLAEHRRRALDHGQAVLDVVVSAPSLGNPEVSRFWRVSYVPVRGSDRRVLGLAAVVEDVTERKLAEAERDRLYRIAELARAEAEQANRAKDEFLAIVSHELRSPLSAMSGWVRILSAHGRHDPPVERALAILDRNIRLQTQVISDLLDVSRFLSGKAELQAKVVRLTPNVEASVESARPTANELGVKLILELPPEPTPILVRGDSDRLAQVFSNLLSNAIKFTPPGGAVRVVVTSDGEVARVQVSDTGRGIESELLPFVFERFRQGENASTRTQGGLGLGLAIVKHLVDLHGGAVRAESAGAGRGASFTVELPLAVGAVEEIAAPPVERSDGHGLHGLRVLLVEDDVDAREALRILLEGEGMQVGEASSLAEGLAAFDRDVPDLLLSDIGLPGGSGYELIRQVRRLEESGRQRTLAIAMTGFASTRDREEAVRAGFDEHLRKPVDLDLLLERIQVLVASLSGRGLG